MPRVPAAKPIEQGVHPIAKEVTLPQLGNTAEALIFDPTDVVNAVRSDRRNHVHDAVIRGDLIHLGSLRPEEYHLINQADIKGDTPLHLALSYLDFKEYGKINLKMVKILMEKGADATARGEENRYGYSDTLSPFVSAACHGSPKAALIMLEAGCNPQAVRADIEISISIFEQNSPDLLEQLKQTWALQDKIDKIEGAKGNVTVKCYVLELPNGKFILKPRLQVNQQYLTWLNTQAENEPIGKIDSPLFFLINQLRAKPLIHSTPPKLSFLETIRGKKPAPASVETPSTNPEHMVLQGDKRVEIQCEDFTKALSKLITQQTKSAARLR